MGRLPQYRASMGALILSMLAVVAVADAADDGLEQVEDDVFTRAWIRPGVDLVRFSKIRFESGGMQFAETDTRRRRSGSLRRTRSDYEVSDEDKATLRAIFAEAFNGHFRGIEGFQIVAEFDDQTLIARTALLNIQMLAQGDPKGAMEAVEYENQGAATLVIELYDGGTEEILARFADAQAIQPPQVTGGAQFSRSSRTFAAWEAMADTWAGQVTERLESYALPSNGAD